MSPAEIRADRLLTRASYVVLVILGAAALGVFALQVVRAVS